MEYIKRSRFNVRKNTSSAGAMCSPKGNKNKLARCENKNCVHTVHIQPRSSRKERERKRKHGGKYFTLLPLQNASCRVSITRGSGLFLINRRAPVPACALISCRRFEIHPGAPTNNSLRSNRTLLAAG